MLAPLGLNHPYAANDAPTQPASRVGAALRYCSDQGRSLVAALLYGSRGPRRPGVSAPFRKGEPAVAAIASERKIIWVRPNDIIYKTRRDHDLRANDILAGDWDLGRVPLVKSTKYQSICKHFRDGVAWEDTELFQDYADRFRQGEVVRGANSLPRLKRQYETKVEAIYRDLAASGFRIARDLFGQPTNLPHVHIGRGGEILYGTKGNHRLAMAKLLSLSVIPCHVRARHAEWQKVREAVLDAVALTNDGGEPSNAHVAFMGHPDLADLYFPNQ